MFLQLSHTKLPIYSESQKLALECYRLTKLFPADERFAMVQQIRRAALSVHLNIAEGSSRKSLAERKRFYEIARGSVIEIDAALDIAFQLMYCDMDALKILGASLVSCFKQLSGLIGGNSKGE
jgi:four helix bundle protein